MAGHMGNRRATVKGLEVIQVDPDRNLLLLKGGVPGWPNALLEIRRTSKPPVTPAALVLDRAPQAEVAAEPLSEEALAEEAPQQEPMPEEQLEQENEVQNESAATGEPEAAAPETSEEST